MKKLKAAAKKIIQFYKRQKFLHSSVYHNFQKNTDRQRVVLIDTPTHGNLGDHAIVMAEQELLEEVLGNDYFEFSHEEYLCSKKIIASSTNQEDIILIHGGGFIGTIWQKEEDVLISILEEFCHNRIIIFPQTVFFEESDNGRKEMDRLKAAVKACSDLTIFLRDAESYRIMTEKLGISRDQCYLVPDIVTYLDVKMDKQRQNKVLFCMRSDKEKTSDTHKILQINNYLTKLGIETAVTDTVIRRKVEKGRRKEAVLRKLEEFSGARLVITDRLHGMLFAAITGTPCIAMDNISRKVSGTFQWIEYLDYVRFAEEEDLTEESLQIMLDKKDCRYSKEELREYYDLMRREVFDGGIL